MRRTRHSLHNTYIAYIVHNVKEVGWLFCRFGNAAAVCVATCKLTVECEGPLWLFYFVQPKGILVSILLLTGGKRWRSWLRHCAASRKVADSIPDGATGIFH